MNTNRTVLIADEDKNLVKNFQTILTSNGYEVSAALTAKDVKEQCANSCFDAVLLSTDLRDMPLKDLVMHLALCFRKSSVVLMTWYPSLEDCINVLDMGVYDILMKPIETAKLIRVVEDVTSTRRSAKFWMGKSPRTRRAVIEYRIMTEKGVKTTIQEISKKYGWNPAAATIRRNLSELSDSTSNGSHD